MEFIRNTRKVRQVALVSLVDVMFFILLFFMFSSSFIHSESMELLLPSTKSKSSGTDQSLRIFLSNDGSYSMNNATLSAQEFEESIRKILIVTPEQKIALLPEDSVSIGQLVAAMDIVYRRGGKSLYVSRWQKPQILPQILSPQSGGL